MPISSTAELLAAIRDWKAAGLPLSRTSHPAVSGHSEAYYTLLKILNQQEQDAGRASDGRTNTEVLREFYEAIRDKGRWQALGAEYLQLTGRKPPESPADWMALAAEYNYPTWGTGEFIPDLILAWVVGRLRSPTKAADPVSSEFPAVRQQQGRVDVVSTLPLQKGQTPPAPFVPLVSWADIFAALNEPHGKAQLKNTDRNRDMIRKLNQKYTGPIRLPQGKGMQPEVSKAALMEWWDGLESRYQDRKTDERQETIALDNNLSDTHPYGRSGTVLPGVQGSEKKRRTKKDGDVRKR